jgi:putative component of toxin-antitoxin plasmid stabilization module
VIHVVEYVDARGRSPYARWFDRLPAQAAAKVAVAVTRMSPGNLSNVKGVGEGVLEYRIDWDQVTGFISAEMARS